jgi:hypothetical protein
MTLVESEQECFESAECERRVPMGKSALKRLENLRLVMDAKKRGWVLSLKLDFPLRASYDTLLTQLDSRYEKVYASVTNAYDYNAALVELEEVEPFCEREVPSQPDYTGFARQRLTQFLEKPEGVAVANALALLQKLYQSERSMAAVVPLVRGPSQTGVVRSNEMKAGILEERLHQLGGLLAMVNGEGVIVIPVEKVLSLRKELAKAERATDHNIRS